VALEVNRFDGEGARSVVVRGTARLVGEDEAHRARPHPAVDRLGGQYRSRLMPPRALAGPTQGAIDHLLASRVCCKAIRAGLADHCLLFAPSLTIFRCRLA
jgi:hypothetical protein